MTPSLIVAVRYDEFASLGMYQPPWQIWDADCQHPVVLHKNNARMLLQQQDKKANWQRYSRKNPLTNRPEPKQTLVLCEECFKIVKEQIVGHPRS